MKKYLILFILILFTTNVIAFAPDTLWTKAYGGNHWDHALSITQNDSNYFVAGLREDDGYDNFVWLLKINNKGDTLWTKTYGKIESFANCIKPTGNGCYIIAGGQSIAYSRYNIYLLKITGSGDTIWTRTCLKSYDEYLCSAEQTKDGGYVAVGVSSPLFGAGGKDIYILKTNGSGDTLWTRLYGTASNDEAQSVIQSEDDNYIVLGSCGADNSLWVLKVDTAGDTLWTKRYSGIGWASGRSIKHTNDGCYIASGYTSTNMSGYRRFYLLKIKSNGDTAWTKTYKVQGYSEDIFAYDLQQCKDNGYIIAGTYGTGDDVYLIKTDSLGNELWNKRYGGNQMDRAYCVQQAQDGGYIIAGETYSFGAGSSDAYISKISPLYIIAPVGGEVWSGGNIHKIEWYHENPATVDHFRLSYSTDQGNTYTPLTDTISNVTFSYNWTLPLINSPFVRVKIQALNSGGSTLFEDASDSNLIIDSTPPSSVTLVSPLDKSYIGDYTMSFKWNRATDNLSGIDHYILQYALDSLFSQGLVETSFKDTTINKTLTDSAYYWHVRAIDKAANIGEWSSVWNFIVDTLSPQISNTTVYKDTTFHGPFPVYATIKDNIGISKAELWFVTTSSSTWTSISMDSTGIANEYLGVIPLQSTNNITILYYIFAKDFAKPSNIIRDPPSNGYSFIAGYTGVEDEKFKIPDKFFIKQNSFNSLVFNYGVPRNVNVNLSIYNLLGQKVITLVDGNKDAGYYNVNWEGKDNLNSRVSRGIYFYKFEAGEFRTTKKLIFVR
ncbi:MAG: T9SS type A sorting domain-containing protein [bacterium]